jgi:hypothetical protein
MRRRRCTATPAAPCRSMSQGSPLRASSPWIGRVDAAAGGGDRIRRVCCRGWMPSLAAPGGMGKLMAGTMRGELCSLRKRKNM